MALSSANSKRACAVSSSIWIYRTKRTEKDPARRFAGHPLDLRRIDGEAWIEASIRAHGAMRAGAKRVGRNPGITGNYGEATPIAQLSHCAQHAAS
jgi:hypothetical protein